jgi:hypothetical protein
MAMSTSDAPPAPAAAAPAAAPAGQAHAARPLPRRGLERLDLMLLTLEALDLNGGEAMVWMSAQPAFAERLPNRVELWKLRSHNPLRRACRRGTLAPVDSDALIRLLCQMADRLYPMLRSLLSASEPAERNAQHWALLQERLSDLVRERMNPRRSAVQRLLEPEAGQRQLRTLVQALAFAAGPGGVERLRASLLDAAP